MSAGTIPFDDNVSWMAVLIEKTAFEDYQIEYSGCTAPPTLDIASSTRSLDKTRSGSTALPHSGEFFAAAKMVPLEVPHHHIALPEAKEGKSWMAAGVLLCDGEEFE